MRARDVARFVMVLKLLGGKRVVDIAAAKFDIDRSSVTKHMKAYGKQEGWGAVYVKQSFSHLRRGRTERAKVHAAVRERYR